ncbi:MAG: retropepsin-like aspartic protease family protein, partial [Microcystaceae cyanobacterium]
MNLLFRGCCCSVLAIAIGFLPGIVRANGTCFLQGADGQAVDLSRLCGRSPKVPAKTVRQNFYQIPIKQRVGNIPSVEVLLNGQHLVEMLFDTGASA